MSAAKQFRTIHDRIMDDANKRVQVIREEIDKELETLAIKHFGAVDSRDDDGFGPPSDPVKVHCWHCDQKYSSSEMSRMYRPRMQGGMTESLGQGMSRLEPLWWCKDLECDGGGFGHDIHPVKPRKPRAKKAVAA